jgi:hypothetical protein
MAETQEEFEKRMEAAAAKQKLRLSRGHEWAISEVELAAIAAKFPKKSDSELAKLCGYFSSEFFKDALSEGIKQKKEEDAEDSGSLFPAFQIDYFIYKEGTSEHLVYTDENHGGYVYVPEKIIKANPNFYEIADWEQVNKEFLEDSVGTYEEDIEDTLNDFKEPMMSKSINTLCPADYEEGEYPDEKFETEAQGVRYDDIFDVGGHSRWGDG